MYSALAIGETGLQAQARQLDVIAHNLANVNTTGFRGARVSFLELTTAAAPVSALDAIPVAARAGAGTAMDVTLSTTAGQIRATGEPLDVAIVGAGFLEVRGPGEAPVYTRAGALRVSADGLLVTAAGAPLAQELSVPPDATGLRIDADGLVTAALGDGETLELGQLELATFANPGGLAAAGDNLYAATTASGPASPGRPGEDGRGTLRQGHLEGANVQLVDELVALMLAQRAFEMNSRVVQAADQLLSVTNGLYRT